MSNQTLIVAPGPRDRSVRTADGAVLEVPADWQLVPPGDAALTRRLKAAGLTWTVQEIVRRKKFSRGVWAPAATVDAIRIALASERETPQHARKMQAAAQRREATQADYVQTFHESVTAYLAFHPAHAELRDRLSRAVTDHATPVGSGTVARTQRIPVEQRAEAAVIAWMRHQTTAYDSMAIARVKGKRREVRRLLAARSKALLDVYRRDGAAPVNCPLRRALFPAA